MLSGETAIGNYPIQSLRYMKNIILEAEKNMNLTEFSCFMEDFEKVDIKNRKIMQELLIIPRVLQKYIECCWNSIYF